MNRRKVVSMITLMVLVILGVVLCVWFSGLPSVRTDLSIGLQHAVIDAAVGDGHPGAEKVLSLSSLTPFQWEELIVVKPYDQLTTINVDRRTMFQLRRINIETRDDICVLVFKAHSKTVHILTMPRDVDFSRLSRQTYATQEAFFRLTRSGDNRIVLRDTITDE